MAQIYISSFSNQETKESLEKKIKDIKKSIKNCSNYIQKKNLEKELSELRTELKQLKKRRNKKDNITNVNNNEISTPNETRATISFDLNHASCNNRIYTLDDWCSTTSSSYICQA